MELKKAGSGLSSYFSTLPYKFRKVDKTLIVPTSFGFSFAAMVLILFFLAAGYSNNLIFILVFFTIAAGVSSTHFTNNNVKNVEAIAVSYDKVFALESSPFHVQVLNKGRRGKAQLIRLSFLNPEAMSVEVDEIGSHESRQVTVPFQFQKRGLHFLPEIKIEGDFPFGFLNAWKVKDLKTEVIVYPHLKGHLVFPREASLDQAQNSFGVFKDHKVYQSGDSKNKIDWRASAKRQSLLVKNYEEPEGLKLSFRWEQTQHLTNIEDRISQLALWVTEAEKLQADYAVHIGNFKADFAHGPQHWKRIMEYLALMEVAA